VQQKVCGWDTANAEWYSSVSRNGNRDETRKDRYVIACKGWSTKLLEKHMRLMNMLVKRAEKVREEFATEGAMVVGMARSPDVD
jgi:hypothetical protein